MCVAGVGDPAAGYGHGARAMGCAEEELGVLREGALADLIVVDLSKPHLQPLHDVVSNLVYCGKAADVETVMVDGRIVVEDRRIPASIWRSFTAVWPGRLPASSR